MTNTGTSSCAIPILREFVFWYQCLFRCLISRVADAHSFINLRLWYDQGLTNFLTFSYLQTSSPPHRTLPLHVNTLIQYTTHGPRELQGTARTSCLLYPHIRMPGQHKKHKSNGEVFLWSWAVSSPSVCEWAFSCLFHQPRTTVENKMYLVLFLNMNMTMSGVNEVLVATVHLVSVSQKASRWTKKTDK